ncbi:hypothetical protein NTJ28_001688 [Flavobacterium psychrophilum]|nr:hypothetical protein [Flavobacterium psychrophilum]EKT4510335.1 hypothetical protein [Flavobacterium psychrophilum]
MKITITKNQSLFDVAIQEFGSALAVVDLALSNNLNVTDLLVPGQKIIIEKSVYKDKDVIDFFRNKNQLIATSYPAQIDVEVPNYLLPNVFPILL